MQKQFLHTAAITLAICLGLGTTFAAGFVLNSLLNTEQQPLPTPQPSAQSSDNPEIITEQNHFLPDKHYLQDTIFVINKQAPHQSLIATVTRAEGLNKQYTQSTRVSYFNGEKWNRELRDQKNNSASIFSNNIVKEWKIDIDPSRVLKENVSGTISINNSTIGFNSGELQNEIAMRSLPGYTKFMSHANGTIKINNAQSDAYILYTRIYSLNASDIQFYNQPLGLTTEWVAFWDINNNFYHVDKTKVTKETPIYKTHQIGVKVDANNTVAKTFSVATRRDSDKDPKNFTFQFGNPINSLLQVSRLNVENKAPNFTYTWQMSQVEGTISTESGEKNPGFGIVEYIKD